MKRRGLVAAALIVAIIGFAVWWVFLRYAPVASAPQGNEASNIGNNLTLGLNATSSGKYLVAYNGMALYVSNDDQAMVSVCDASCVRVWPPYIVPAGTALHAEYPLDGELSTLKRPDGSLQVTYNSRPLYFYSGDTRPDDTLGAHINDTWSLAQP